ncbi:unnamed protein product [Cylicostephanus goldi]|uniref:Mnd1 HTH domain-containing protein n=1 Tax=Cylicostephanus goldi TaxID=71465 RepID=A0A3P6UNC8_CYLGO|nr:unnamed protein product [Cylicostephanus goldi]
MASRKKGLSLEEKRAKMLELFYETQEFYQMKELEKIAPKKKGIIAQSVKEVTQSLVDDGLVECEKIGTFVCYWAFPSKALQVVIHIVPFLHLFHLFCIQEKAEIRRIEVFSLRAGRENQGSQL